MTFFNLGRQIRAMNMRTNLPKSLILAMLGVASLGGGIMTNTQDAEAQNATLRQSVSPTTMTVREAHEQAQTGNVVLVDIRTPEEWADTGVPVNAIRLDMREPSFEARLAALRAANPGKDIALICRTANRTVRVQDALSARGWTGLINVKGGLLGNPTDTGWLAEGLPVTQVK
jgi:rhodanese-related sulfurtransferase